MKCEHGVIAPDGRLDELRKWGCRDCVEDQLRADLTATRELLNTTTETLAARVLDLTTARAELKGVQDANDKLHAEIELRQFQIRGLQDAQLAVSTARSLIAAESMRERAKAVVVEHDYGKGQLNAGPELAAKLDALPLEAE